MKLPNSERAVVEIAKLRDYYRGMSMSKTIELLDVVALMEDLPGRGLSRGQVGTVVETLAPGVYEVEFGDDQGRTYASLALRGDQVMVLHYRPLQVA